MGAISSAGLAELQEAAAQPEARPSAAQLLPTAQALEGIPRLERMLLANARLLSQYGLRAVMDGGLQQLGELVFQGLLSCAAYVVFKTCEHRLSDWLGHGPP